MTETNRVVLDGQRQHWQATFEANPGMYGTDPSVPGRYALGLFARQKTSQVLELGAGQGRDTLAFLRAGLTVTAKTGVRQGPKSPGRCFPGHGSYARHRVRR